MIKEQFEDAVLEVFAFDAEDVITTSCSPDEYNWDMDGDEVC